MIERLSSVYQVDRLNQSYTVRIEEDRRMEFPDHEFGPDFHQLAAQRYHHVLDLQNEAASTEVLTHIAGSNWHGRNVLKDGKSRFIIYATGIFQDQGEQNFIAEYGRNIRSFAALIAREVINARETVRFSGEQLWLGKMHDALTFEMPNSPPLTIYVEKDTGYITYMDRTVGEATKVSYTFRRYAIQDGIPVAGEHSVYANNARIFYSFARRLVVDRPQDRNAFELDPGLEPEPAQVDQTEMTVEQVGEGVHHVGQNGSYSTFFLADRGIVAYGMNAGFGDRLKAYRDQTAIELPLTHAIVADLHGQDRLGAPDAAQEGALLLVTRDAAGRVQSMLEESHPEARIQTVDNRLQVGDVIMFNVATAQAAQNLVAYHAPSGVFTQTGHFSNPYLDGPGYADYTAVTLRDALAPLGLAPKFILSNENRKAERWDQFIYAVNSHRPEPCFEGRAICRGWNP